MEYEHSRNEASYVETWPINYSFVFFPLVSSLRRNARNNEKKEKNETDPWPGKV